MSDLDVGSETPVEDGSSLYSFSGSDSDSSADTDAEAPVSPSERTSLLGLYNRRSCRCQENVVGADYSTTSSDGEGSPLPPHEHSACFPPSRSSSSTSTSDSSKTFSSWKARHGSEREISESDYDLVSLHLEDEDSDDDHDKKEEENPLNVGRNSGLNPLQTFESLISTSEAPKHSGQFVDHESLPLSLAPEGDHKDQSPPLKTDEEGEEENPVLHDEVGKISRSSSSSSSYLLSTSASYQLSSSVTSTDYEESPSPEADLDSLSSEKEDEKERKLRKVMKRIQRNSGRSSSPPNLSSTLTSKSPFVRLTGHECSSSTATLNVDRQFSLVPRPSTQTRQFSPVISTDRESSSPLPEVDLDPSSFELDDEVEEPDTKRLERNYGNNSPCSDPCSTSIMNAKKLRSVRFVGHESLSPTTEEAEIEGEQGRKSVVDGDGAMRICTIEEYLKTISSGSYSDCEAESNSENYDPMQVHHKTDLGAEEDELAAATGIGQAPFNESRTKDIPCKFHDGISGMCWKGDRCVYGHELHTGGLYEKRNPVLAYAASKKAGAASVSNIFSKPFLNVGAEIIGYITYVRDPSEFYLRLHTPTPTAHECACTNAWKWLKTEKPDIETYSAGHEFSIKSAEERTDGYFYGFNLIEIPEGFDENPSPNDIPRVKLIEDHLHDALALGMRYRSLQKNEYRLDSEIVAVRMKDRWRRAVVLMEQTELCKDAVRVYSVRCIDTGDILTVDSTNMCRLPERFGIIPAQAYRCFLYGVSSNLPGIWSDNAIEEFTKLVYMRKVRIMIMKGLKGKDDVNFGITERRPYFVKVFLDTAGKTLDLTRVMIEGDYGVEWSEDPKFPFEIKPGMPMSEKFGKLIQEWKQRCQKKLEEQEAEKLKNKIAESKKPIFEELTDPGTKKLELRQKKKKKLKMKIKSRKKKKAGADYDISKSVVPETA